MRKREKRQKRGDRSAWEGENAKVHNYLFME